MRAAPCECIDLASAYFTWQRWNLPWPVKDEVEPRGIVGSRTVAFLRQGLDLHLEEGDLSLLLRRQHFVHGSTSLPPRPCSDLVYPRATLEIVYPLPSSNSALDSPRRGRYNPAPVSLVPFQHGVRRDACALPQSLAGRPRGWRRPDGRRPAELSGVSGPTAAVRTAPRPTRRTAPADDPAPPKGVEVLTRGPIHEAFATPTDEPQATTPVAKEPPKAIEEMPPEEKPEGDAIWIGGYWAWDEDRSDYLWVSGVWRTPPPDKHWVAGYWREDGDKWQWVPGFWAEAQQEAEKHEVTYLPAPPAAAGDGRPRSAARRGQLLHPRPVRLERRPLRLARRLLGPRPARLRLGAGPLPLDALRLHLHQRLLGSGPQPSRRHVRPGRHRPQRRRASSYVYTPAYVVPQTVVVDAFFVRPCCCHYYFGDYYGPAYHDCGFESCRRLQPAPLRLASSSTSAGTTATIRAGRRGRSRSSRRATPAGAVRRARLSSTTATAGIAGSSSQQDRA